MKNLFLRVIFVLVFFLCGCNADSGQGSQNPEPVTTDPVPVTILEPTKTTVPTQTSIPPTATFAAALLPVPVDKDEVVSIENSQIEEIKAVGVGHRFVIVDPILMGSDLVDGGLTFREGATPGTTDISTDFPGDVMPLPNVYGQRVWRFQGTVSLDLQDQSGAIYTYRFVGEGDELNLLTFGRFPEIGFVYLRGKGSVISPDGVEVRLGD